MLLSWLLPWLPWKPDWLTLLKQVLLEPLLLPSHGAFHAFGRSALQEQEFQPIVARVNGSSMTLAVTAIVLPRWWSPSNGVEQAAIANLSITVAAVLIVVYGLTLLFSLKTHSHLTTWEQIWRKQMSNQLLTTQSGSGSVCIYCRCCLWVRNFRWSRWRRSNTGTGTTPLLRVLFFTPDWRCSRVCNCGQCSN